MVGMLRFFGLGDTEPQPYFVLNPRGMESMVNQAVEKALMDQGQDGEGQECDQADEGTQAGLYRTG